MSRYDGFDYEEARLDVLDNGGDPDELEGSEAHRDEYLKKMGLHPEDYKSHSSRSSQREEPERKADEGCYVTTACIRAKDLPDDCEELAVLRTYRDAYIQERPGGPEDVQTYYRYAPEIVAAVEERPDAGRIWSGVYRDMVHPCVKMIRGGEYEKVYALYKDYTLRLYQTYVQKRGTL